MKINLLNSSCSIIILFSLFIFPLTLSSQENTGGGYSVNADKVSIGLSGGPTLFWGDIDASNKASIEMGIHYNNRVTSYMCNSFSFHRGKLKGEKATFKDGNAANLGFENDFWQIDRVFKFYPFSHPKMKLDLPISPYIFVGLGFVNYKSYNYNTLTDKVIDRVGYSREAFNKSYYQTDLIVPMGLGTEVPIGEMFTVFAEHKLLYTHSDLLDAKTGTTKVNDWYSITSIGVNLNIDKVLPGIPSHTMNKIFGESLLDKLTFGISGGALLFWGDGEQNTTNPFGKMFDFRRRTLGGGLHIEKEYTDRVHLRLSSIFGELTGIRYTWTNNKPANFYFNNKFYSIDLSQKYYFIANPEKMFSLYGSVGIGIIAYRSAAYHLVTDKLLRFEGYKDAELTKDKRNVDPIIPVGIGVDLNLQRGISVFIEQSFIYSHTDYLDAWKGKGTRINDIYSYANIGVKYNLFNKEESFYNE